MTKKIFRFSISLDENEFIEVEDHIFTTHDILKREEHNVVIIGPKCLEVLKDFKGQLTMKAVKEWLLLGHALDQSCSYRSKWDDHKILGEIIAGKDHSISWYVENCHSTK
jgi:hypothetical protein